MRLHHVFFSKNTCNPPGFPLEWLSFPLPVAAVLITPKGAESPSSGCIGVIGALCFCSIKGRCKGLRRRAPTGLDQSNAVKREAPLDSFNVLPPQWFQCTPPSIEWWWAIFERTISELWFVSASVVLTRGLDLF